MAGMSVCIYCKSCVVMLKLLYPLQLREDELESIRQLRSILSVSGGDFFEAELELCQAYALGFYGGVSEVQALNYIRQIMEQAKPFFLERIFTLQDMNADSR